MREHLARHVDAANAWSWLAIWLAETGRLEEAAEARDRAVGLAPDRVHQLPGMAGTHLLLGDDEGAIRIFCERIRSGAGIRSLPGPGLQHARDSGWQRVTDAARESVACRPGRTRTRDEHP
jgi:hypothetical protein